MIFSGSSWPLHSQGFWLHTGHPSQASKAALWTPDWGMKIPFFLQQKSNPPSFGSIIRFMRSRACAPFSFGSWSLNISFKVLMWSFVFRICSRSSIRLNFWKHLAAASPFVPSTALGKDLKNESFLLLRLPTATNLPGWLAKLNALSLEEIPRGKWWEIGSVSV